MSMDGANNGELSQGPDEPTINVEEKTAEGESSGLPAISSTQSTESTEQSSTEVKTSSKKLCGVCNQNEGKYKCTRCYLPYCSVACSKQHKINHPPDEPKIEPETAPTSKMETNTHRRPGTVAGAVPFKGPFAALDSSPQLKLLFKLYPNLPTILNKINTATLPPLDGYTPSGLPTSVRKGNEQPWNSDRGLQKGVEALKKARNEDGKDGESVREYGRVVLHILREEEGMTTEEAIRKEEQEENARIIEQLLNGDIG